MEDAPLTPEIMATLKRMPKATPANNRAYRFRMNHDFWQWVLIAIGLGSLFLLELTR